MYLKLNLHSTSCALKHCKRKSAIEVGCLDLRSD